jgi:hypothetical protein
MGFHQLVCYGDFDVFEMVECLMTRIHHITMKAHGFKGPYVVFLNLSVVGGS